MKKLLENPKGKFSLLSKIFTYGSILIGIFTLITYTLNGLEKNDNVFMYVLTGIVYSISTILTGWTLGLIMLWLRSTYKEDVL